MLKKYDKNGTEVNLLQDKDIESNSNYCKLPDGTLIQWGYVVCNAGVDSGTINFKITFVGPYNITATHSWYTENKGYCTLGRNDQNSAKILVYDHVGGITRERGASVIAIGRWK